jgi:predicted 3-demethylubiquinone-9 3-methyltransferase (glyoxalase superfamily)
MQKITPFLWFDDQSEQAVEFYTSIFNNSKIGTITRYGEQGPGQPGTVMSATFYLEGQEFTALNGGPVFSFSPAISFFVHCEGGEVQQCGWLTDKFGVSWQIVPTILGQLLNDPDPHRSSKVTQAMLKMVKLDIGLLKQAYEQAYEQS